MILLCKKISRVQLEVFKDAVGAVGIHDRDPIFSTLKGKGPLAHAC